MKDYKQSEEYKRLESWAAGMGLLKVARKLNIPSRIAREYLTGRRHIPKNVFTKIPVIKFRCVGDTHWATYDYRMKQKEWEGRPLAECILAHICQDN
jgi:hypothetical protein